MARKILFLAANPIGTSHLRLDKEVRGIDEGLRLAQRRQDFELVQRWAVRPQDIRRALLEENPAIIHFSGHGDLAAGGSTPADARKFTPVGDGSDSTGHLIVEDNQGNPKPLEPTALANLFELFAEHIECVVLNSCYSKAQAEAIAAHIPYVIGTQKAIGDRAAIEFAVGFYDGLGAGRPIEFAFKLGRSAIEMEGLNEALTPVLISGQASTPSASPPPESSTAAPPITLSITGPAEIPLGQKAYFTILSHRASRGVWSIGGFNNNQPFEVNPLSPSHQIYIEPTDAGRVGDGFTLVFTAYDAQGNSAMATKDFSVTPAYGSQPVASNSASSSPRRSRGQLFQDLSALPGPQFEQVMFSLDPPRGNVPGPAAAQASRLAALLEWASSPIGPGLGAVEATLNEVIGNP